MIRIALAAIAVVSVLALVGFSKADKDLTEQVKQGELLLFCNIKDKGEIQISPDKIKYFSEGRWYFTNGSATQCEVK